MNIAIKGAVSGVKNIIEMVEAHTSHRVACILENNGGKIGQEIAGVKVVQTLEGRKAWKKGRLDAVVLPGSLSLKTLASMVRELQSMGIAEERIKVADPSIEHGRAYVQLVPYRNWHALDYLEFHVSHVCNLNCKGCCHFSSLTKQKFPDFDEWNMGITRLHTIFPFIKRIHLLGGEPLINPELPRYAARTRDLYPDSIIEVVTNAILADRLTEEVIDVLRRAAIKVSVSAYPGVFDRATRGIEFLHAHGLLGSVHTATEFTKMLTRERKTFPYRSIEYVCHCPNLVGTKLYACPIIAYLSDFNAYFHADFPMTGGCVDLADASMTVERLREELYRPFPLCDYCRSYLTEGIRASNDDSIAWASYRPGDVPTMSDWLLDGQNA